MVYIGSFSNSIEMDVVQDLCASYIIDMQQTEVANARQVQADTTDVHTTADEASPAELDDQSRDTVS